MRSKFPLKRGLKRYFVMKKIVSFSGGKDSTAMLLRMIEEDFPIDEIIFCDTGVEYPETYAHIKKVEEYIGRKITVLKAKHNFEYYLKEVEKKDGSRGYGFPNTKFRWCTALLKIKLIKEHMGKDKFISYIGLASDEIKRIEKTMDKELKSFPLLAWNMTEADCLQYCYDRGFDFGGFYNTHDRMGCWCCPFQTIQDLRLLRKKYPVEWEQIITWEKETGESFKQNIAIASLEERFKKEINYE